MKAWQVKQLGDPEQALRLEEVEEPEPGRGEVVVEVEAAALNFFDISCRSSTRRAEPLSPGGDRGTVQEAGEARNERRSTLIATPPLARRIPAEVAVPESRSFRSPINAY